jgi:beta-lactamase regulating signal transducer with metallopeptidase domain
MDAVLNWLCQGFIVALAAAAALRVLGSSHAQVRYVIVWVALLAVALLPCVPILKAALQAGVPEPASGLAGVVSLPARWWTSVGVALGLWALWSLLYAGRVATGLLAVRRARAAARPMSPATERALRCWCAVGPSGRCARVVLSDDVRFAAVLGGRAPVIALAPRLLDYLTAEELDRIVIHEWAHVERRDDLAHIAQLCLRIAVGWHPAIWWLDRQLNLEREAACDEIAVAVTGSARGYAACLAKLAGLQAPAIRSVVPAVGFSSGSLRRRIVRILSIGATPYTPRTVTATVAGGALALVAAGVSHIPAFAVVRVLESTMLGGPLVLVASAPAMVTAASGDGSAAALHGARTSTVRRGSTARGSMVETTPGSMPVSPPAGGDAAESGPPVAIDSPAEPARRRTEPLPSLVATPLPRQLAPSSRARTSEPAEPLWQVAAHGGKAIGRTSQKAATASAALFTRAGQRIARSLQ